MKGVAGLLVDLAAAALVLLGNALFSAASRDGLNPFDRKLVQALALALAGIALMALAERLLHGPARFAACLLLWAITSWLTLRYGLTREDRLALGGLSRRLRLV